MIRNEICVGEGYFTLEKENKYKLWMESSGKIRRQVEDQFLDILWSEFYEGSEFFGRFRKVEIKFEAALTKNQWGLGNKILNFLREPPPHRF